MKQSQLVSKLCCLLEGHCNNSRILFKGLWKHILCTYTRVYVALWLNAYQLRSDKQQGTTYAVINYSRPHSPLLLLSSLSSKVLWLTWMVFGAQCTSTKRLYVDPLTVVLTPNYLCCHSKMECVCVRARAFGMRRGYIRCDLPLFSCRERSLHLWVPAQYPVFDSYCSAGGYEPRQVLCDVRVTGSKI